jgi:dTDP-glucose 4,6-dehydratase
MIASTSEVYGDPLVHPQPEGYWGNVNPIGIRGVYDEAKRYAEAITMAYHRHHGVDTRIARIFNTYGPRMRPDDGRMIPNFVSQALGGEPLTIYGDGSQTRSVQYVDDLIEGVFRLMRSDERRPVNVGNPVEYSVREVAALILELSGSASELVHKPLPKDDPKQRCPDITRARDSLGWEPKVSAREGLGLTLNWFAKRLEGASAGR